MNKKIKKRFNKYQRQINQNSNNISYYMRWNDSQIRNLKKNINQLSGIERYDVDETSTSETLSSESSSSTDCNWKSWSTRTFQTYHKDNYRQPSAIILLFDNYTLRTKKFYYTNRKKWWMILLYTVIGMQILYMIFALLIIIGGAA